MLVSTSAIILSVLKYNENDAIVKTFTEKTGFTTFFVKGLYKPGKNKIKKAYLQPAAMVEMIFNYKNKSQMEYLKEVAPAYHYHSLYIDFDKLNMSIFLREILLGILQEEPADENLFRFIVNEFQKLDREEFKPDFHLYFLIKLLAYTGLTPRLHSQGKYFDLQEAVFTDTPQSYELSMNEEQSRIFKTLLGIIFAYEKEIELTNMQRKKILRDLIKYLELHNSRFKSPKSLEILGSLYS